MRGERSIGRLAGEGVAACAALAVAALLLFAPPGGSDAVASETPEATASPRPVPPGAALDNRCQRGKVALTFDDGPGPYTPAVLAILRRYQVKATFFVLGSKVAANPELLRQVAADGHVIANHTWDHPHLVDLTPAQVRDQLIRTQQAVAAARVPPAAIMRPPYGSTDSEVARVAAGLHLKVSLWSYDSEDWRGRKPVDMANGLFANLLPATVVLLHDGTADPSNTIAALPSMIEGLRARGYCTVTQS